MITFKEGKLAYEILTKVALTGELPIDMLSTFGKEGSVKAAAKKMQKEKYLHITGTGRKKVLKLTKKGTDKLSELNPDYYDYHMSMHSHNSGSKTFHYRTQRTAEVMCYMAGLGCGICKNEKPVLYLDSSQQAERIPKDEFFFYTSREIKRVDENQRYKIDFTRMIGVLFSPGGIYSVFNTNQKRMKWNTHGEGKMQVYLDDIIRNNYSLQASSLTQAIMFVKDFELGAEIMQSSGGIRDTNGFELLQIDKSYDNMHVVPFSFEGFSILKMLTTENWHDTLMSALFKPEFRPKETISIDCDAVANGTYMLSFLDCDINRLQRFFDAYPFYPEASFVVLCFSWQKPMLEKCMPQGIEIQIVSLASISTLFFHETEE